eukprot:839858-Prymnesium_polylepis.1
MERRERQLAKKSSVTVCFEKELELRSHPFEVPPLYNFRLALSLSPQSSPRASEPVLGASEAVALYLSELVAENERRKNEEPRTRFIKDGASSTKDFGCG